MSKIRNNYENSRWHKFEKWVAGDVDILNENMEIRAPKDEKKAADKENAILDEMKEQNLLGVYDEHTNRELKVFDWIYRISSIVLCFTLIGVLLWMVLAMPAFGDINNPVNNEVAARYIEKGVEETGAINFVTGMILDYRAFDTFGESCVLFIACICVQILLRLDDNSNKKGVSELINIAKTDRLMEPKNDLILQKEAIILVPLLMIFGIYVILNGHLSPGGGFSGGAIIGAALILYLNAYGFKRTERFFTNKTFRVITLCALSFYCIAKSYSFFTGANHLESGIPTGTPGAILSSGLILPLNICVGLVVACTMYSFYTFFRKGGF